MLFLNEYLSHGYTDTRRGVLDSTVWDGIQRIFKWGDLKMSDKGTRFEGGSGGHVPPENFEIWRPKNGIFNILHETFKKLNLDKVIK